LFREAFWLSDGSIDLFYLFDGSVLDTDRRELRRDGTTIDIEPQVFDLLEYLIRHRERVVSRDELIEQIWCGRVVSESALSTRINAVRNAVGDSGVQQRLLKTLPRKGIRFVGEVREEQHAPEEALANTAENRAIATTDMRPPLAGLPVRTMVGSASDLSSPATASVLMQPRTLVPRASLVVLAAVGLLCVGALAWRDFARSERTTADIAEAARLVHIGEQINMTSRENYEAARTLQQWAADLDPHNATAKTRLTFAIVTGVLNHWSNDVAADLQAANLSLQDAIQLAPNSMIVNGARCHILRAMRQFESAITLCSEAAQRFPAYAFLHKEIGYNRLMLGQLDEALAAFREADRIAPDAPLRWSWNQGIGLIYLMQGQDQKAIDLLSRAALEAPNAGHPAAYLASAYALVGREQEAREALAHYVKLWPNASLSNFGPMVGTAAFNSKMERVIEGLRLAGLPERVDDAPAVTSMSRRADGGAHPGHSRDIR
jgi:DNA-binding winged helix-turn-helix (wHTH) protein/Flp pilus assembly protein TadD